MLILYMPVSVCVSVCLPVLYHIDQSSIPHPAEELGHDTVEVPCVPPC